MNKENVFILKMAYQITTNLTHYTWKLWPQQTALQVTSLPVSDNQEVQPCRASF